MCFIVQPSLKNSRVRIKSVVVNSPSLIGRGGQAISGGAVLKFSLCHRWFRSSQIGIAEKPCERNLTPKVIMGHDGFLVFLPHDEVSRFVEYICVDKK